MGILLKPGRIFPHDALAKEIDEDIELESSLDGSSITISTTKIAEAVKHLDNAIKSADAHPASQVCRSIFIQFSCMDKT